MWLRYGVAQDQTLVSIEDVKRGKTQLVKVFLMWS